MNCDFKRVDETSCVWCENHAVDHVWKIPSHAHSREKKKVLTSASMKSFQNLPELGNCVTRRSYVFLALSMGWF